MTISKLKNRRRVGIAAFVFINVALLYALYKGHTSIAEIAIICDTTIVYAWYGVNTYNDKLDKGEQTDEHTDRTTEK